MQPLYEYVCHLKGHRNSKGELAEWVIKSHETGKILSSHKSEQKAKEHLQQMHIFNEAAEGEEYCSHCGANADGIETYKGRKLCPSCLTQFKWLDEHRDPENGMYEKYDLVPRESENDDTDESEKEEFRSLLYSMANGYVNDINKFIRKYDISIELIDRETVESEELFDDNNNDLAMAFASLRDDPKVTPIGLNEDLIYYYYVEQFNESYTLFDEFMSDTLWHEAGHAICRWVEDMLDLLDAQYINDEEALVENFGFYMTSKTMHIDKDVSRKLLSKFNGAFAVMDAYNKGCYDDAALRKMLKLFSPNLDSEKLADILETHDIHKKQSASSIQDKKSYKLLGESTYGNDMNKRIKVFMEGVSQLGLSKNQVDAIGKITKVCMEGISDEPSPELGQSDLGKICTYDVNDETPVVQVLSQNVPLQELTKHRENLLRAAPICKVTSDIEKYSMISPYDKITDTAMQYMQGEISFDPSDDGNVYGFKWTCLGRPSICFWMPNDLSYSGYDDAGKLGGNEEEPAEF